MTDLAITQDTTGLWDISISPDGDFTLTDGFDTTLTTSVLCDRRATADEVTNPLRRRGWAGNTMNSDGFEMGSKLWLYSQSRMTNAAINGVKTAIADSLQHLVVSGAATSVGVIATNVGGSLVFEAVVTAIDGKVTRQSFDAWGNTGL